MKSLKQIYIPADGPLRDIKLSPDIFESMGRDNIFKMVADFYRELEYSPIRNMFPADMEEASKKSAAFFVFLLGGPPLYQQQYGSPMMRQRHLPFAIDENARQIWLNCFQTVLADSDKKYNFPIQHKENFWNFLQKFSAWMVNTQS